MAKTNTLELFKSPKRESNVDLVINKIKGEESIIVIEELYIMKED